MSMKKIATYYGVQTIVFALILAVMLFSCEEREFDNPYDPDVDISSLAPYNLEISTPKFYEPHLSWKCNAEKNDGFIIEKKKGEDSWAQAAHPKADILEWTDTDIEINKEYTYRIKTVFGTRSTAEVSASFQSFFPAPTDFALEKIGDKSYRLLWSYNSAGEQGFKIDRRIDSIWQNSIAIVPANQTSYTDTNITHSLNLEYRVYAYYENAVSEKISAGNLPTVSASLITNIEATSATAGGTVVWEGGSNVIGRGVCWSTEQKPDLNDEHTTDGSGTGSFASAMTGLIPDTIYYIRAYATNTFGTAYGDNQEFVTLYDCPSTMTDDEGNAYNTVYIGRQCWMKENLNIGTIISGSEEMTDNSTIEKYCFDNNEANCETYGGLYQWDEIMQYVTNEGARGICPSGWHLPTDDEWKTMEIALGMSQSEADADGYRGSDQGEQMKSTTGWYNYGNGTNSSGFTALPGGYRYSDGSFNYLGYRGYWWSSSESSGALAWGRVLHCDYGQVHRYYYDKTYGRSVRCLKD